LAVLVHPLSVALVGGYVFYAAPEGVRGFPVLADAELGKADVQPEEWFGVPIDRIWRLASGCGKVGCLGKKPLSFFLVAKICVCLCSLQHVESVLLAATKKYGCAVS
jgi:hypothetical protein